MENLKTSYDHLKSLYGDKFMEELEIEAKAKQEAEDKMRVTLEKNLANGLAGEGKLGERFTGNVWADCKENVKALVALVKSPSKTTQGVWRQPLEDLLRIYVNDEEALVDMLSLNTVMILLNEQLQKIDSPLSISVASLKIERAVRNEADLESFCQYEEMQDKAWVRTSMLDGISKRSANSFKLTYFRNRANKEGYQGLSWTQTAGEALGAKLIEAVVYGSGYWYIAPVQVDKRKVQCIMATEWLKKAWESNTNNLVSNAVQYLMERFPYQTLSRYASTG